jgi:hypothetical protein
MAAGFGSETDTQSFGVHLLHVPRQGFGFTKPNRANGLRHRHTTDLPRETCWAAAPTPTHRQPANKQKHGLRRTKLRARPPEEEGITTGS